MRKHLFLFSIIIFLFSCNSDNKDDFDILPDIPVNETIFLNNPEFIDLQVVGGWAYSQGGISGIIIYHSGINNYIADARDKGDLSENAEYHAAKEEQSLLEFKIAQLKNTISKARLIDESLIDSSKVLALSIVKIKNIDNKMEFEYILVADAASDLTQGKLSVNSPIGKGLLGKKVGDIAEIKVPNGIMKFEIINISR